MLTGTSAWATEIPYLAAREVKRREAFFDWIDDENKAVEYSRRRDARECRGACNVRHRGFDRREFKQARHYRRRAATVVTRGQW